MVILLEIHSILRWIIVILGLLAIIKFLIGMARKSPFGKMDRGLSSGFSGLMDTQALLGLMFFFWNGFATSNFENYRWEHMFTMLIAATVAHAPSMFKKKASNKYLTSLGAIVVALLLVYVGVMRLPGGWSR